MVLKFQKISYKIRQNNMQWKIGPFLYFIFCVNRDSRFQTSMILMIDYRIVLKSLCLDRIENAIKLVIFYSSDFYGTNFHDCNVFYKRDTECFKV